LCNCNTCRSGVGGLKIKMELCTANQLIVGNF
jgi:hypothetical protein